MVNHAMKDTALTDDYVCRYGGEECVVLLPNSTLEVAHDIGEKIRKNIEAMRFIKKGLQTHVVSGVEALIRWHYPETGIISPDEFIPVAENSGLINNIGEWVIRTACKQAKSWLEHGLEIPVSVNLSAIQFHQHNLIEMIVSILEVSHKMGLTVIAEGVETVEQLEFVHDLDCEEVQGHLFSRPLPENEVTALLKNPGKMLTPLLKAEKETPDVEKIA